MKIKGKVLFAIMLIISCINTKGQVVSEIKGNEEPRQRILMDFDWKFSFGHPLDAKKDFNVGTSYFSYLSKAGYGDGAASANFDDRTWRTLDLPHDWAVEVPFDNRGSHSHGYKAIGRNFPENSVGWYRKTFTLSKELKGSRFRLEFDGVNRDSKVWVNGFYCGCEPSGYYSFSFDITEFLNYGGENVIAVRADATMEEGWFYEGAGIYRHVWLTRTQPLHVVNNGTFVTTKIKGDNALVSAKIKVINQSVEPATFAIENIVRNANGAASEAVRSQKLTLKSFEEKEYEVQIEVKKPHLWSINDPFLHQLETKIVQEKVVDQCNTNFGFRTILFDPDKGFFLNGEHVKLVGTNNHQDHAGVGCAIPDELNAWRIKQLKSMGCNIYRSSHNPPTPELLDACDRLGMLVIDENRMMGISDQNFNYLRRLIERDRNHPSVILWSIGNEEWSIEGSPKGTDIARTMQAFVKSIDSTRYVNAAISGGWDNGIGAVIDVIGYNYLTHGSTDEHHAKFPWQSSLGTEEGSTHSTRGIYVTDKKKQYMAATDRPTEDGNFMSIHDSWNHYATRDYLAGVCYWTGFDYRGESTPFGWPSVTSYFGIFDLCGFPKDNYYYLKSWWTNEPLIHILPHWNWAGKEGEEIEVFVYSNCEEVELFLNKKSLGKKEMKRNGMLSWNVKYKPGTLEAVGYNQKKKTIRTDVSTTLEASVLKLESDKMSIKGNREDVAILAVKTMDKNGKFVPDANVPVTFTIQGPAQIIGVGNGDPTSHENEKFVERIEEIKFMGWKEKLASEINIEETLSAQYDDSQWSRAFGRRAYNAQQQSGKKIFRSKFELSKEQKNTQIKWLFSSIGKEQDIYLNGKILNKDLKIGKNYEFVLDQALLHEGSNIVTIVTEPFVKANQWDNVNTNPGVLQSIVPVDKWSRSTFNGMAQIIIRSTGEAGEITLTATSPNLKECTIKINAEKALKRNE